MDNTLTMAGLCFGLGFALIWLALHFGSQWLATRQAESARNSAAALAAMFIHTDARRILIVNSALLIMLPLLAWLLTTNLLVTGICLVAAFAGPRHMVRYLSRRRLRRFESQLPDALMMLTGALRAGASLPMALESVALESQAPVSQEFDLLLREIRLGVDFAIALRNLEQRVPLQDLAMVTAGMALARDVGANLAETMESIANTTRAKLQLEGKIRSLTAQGKMQGIVMSLLPLFLMLVLHVMEPEAMAPLFSEWYGWCTLAVIVVAVAIGYHFISKITSIDV